MRPRACKTAAGRWAISSNQASLSSCSAVKVARVPSSAGNVDVQFSLLVDGRNYVQWFYQGNVLYAFWSKSGTRRVPAIVYVACSVSVVCPIAP